jgi:hypothetical protein
MYPGFSPSASKYEAATNLGLDFDLDVVLNQFSPQYSSLRNACFKEGQDHV